MIFNTITDEQLAGFFKEKPEYYTDNLCTLVDDINEIFDALAFMKSLGNPPSTELHMEFQKLFDQFKKELIICSVQTGKQLTLEVAEQIVNHSGSFIRGRLLVDIKNCLTKDEWFKLFFNYWSMIEIADEIIKDLKLIFENEDMYQIMKKYASKQDFKAYLNLPEKLTVYRGCSTNSVDGLSWTFDIKKAKFFAKRRFDLFSKNSFMIIRIISDIRCPEEQQKYLNMPFEETYIAHATVDKKDCLFFDGRGESELFTCKADIYDSILFESLDDIDAYEVD